MGEREGEGWGRGKVTALWGRGKVRRWGRHTDELLDLEGKGCERQDPDGVGERDSRGGGEGR